MNSQYTFATRMAELSNLLEDKLSKDIFWARLRFDCEPTLEGEAYLYASNSLVSKEEIMVHRDIKSISERITADGKKLILYGASTTGKTVGRFILEGGGDFHAYCARNHEKYTDGVLGKPVYSPRYIFDHPNEFYILIPSIDTAEEIFNTIMENHFPKEQVEFWFRPVTRRAIEAQTYFDFPEFFPKGTAFVDAGCCDCGTSIRFSEWCGGDYSKIFAFEPDPENYQKCQNIVENSNLRIELFPLGLSEHTGVLRFAANGTAGSYVMRQETAQEIGAFNILAGEAAKKEITIQCVALDDIVGNTTIGLIKMDIEGAEVDALRGAEQTILWDHPQLAICVYHRCGDVLAIMDYLHNLVPQYRCWLRHYYVCGGDTVLYAAL